MIEQELHPAFGLLDTDESDLRFQQALTELFADDGTVYLISGYFTYQGYLAIRDAIVAFLERNRDNELVVVVGPASDQFSPRIAYDLWSLNTHDQVEVYKRPRGLHAKLYLRDGPNPSCIIGSGNITQVAFEYNVELNVQFTRDRADHPDFLPFLEWLDELLSASKPLGRRDLLAPMLFVASIINWTNKARLLPMRNVALRVLPILFLLVLLAGVFRLV
ncbi:phospholipase D family protein [Natrialbaceae archaeon A-CW2]